MAVASLQVQLQLDNGQFVTRMLQSGQTVQQLQSQFRALVVGVGTAESATNNFANTFRNVMVGLAVAKVAISNVQEATTGWAMKIVEVNAKFETMQKLLQGMSKAADPVKDAGNQVSYLLDMATKTPFSIHALTDTFVKFKSAGLDPTNGSMKAFIDGLSAFGATEDVMQRATVAIQQMAGKGVISMEELRQQLGEAVPRATEIMARSLDMTYQELVQKISQGMIPAQTALQRFFDEMERTFGGSSQNLMNTWTGLVQQLATAWDKLLLSVGNTGYFEEAKKQLRDITALLNSDYAKQYAQELGRGLVTVIGYARSLTEVLLTNRNTLVTLIETLAAFALGVKGIELVGAAFRSLNTAFIGMQAGLAGVSASWETYTLVTTAGISVTERAGLAISATLGVLRGFGLTVASLAGPIGILIALLASAVTYFDLFGSHAKDSFEQLAKYGIVTEDTLRGTKSFMDGLRSEQMKDLELLELLQKKREALAKKPDGATNDESGISTDNKKALADLDESIKETNDRIAKRNDDLTTNNRKMEDGIAKLSSDTAKRQAQAAIDGVDARLTVTNRGYDEEMTAAEAQAQKLYQQAKKEGGDLSKLSEDYRNKNKELRLKQVDETIKIYDDEITQVRDKLKTSNDDQKSALEAELGILQERRKAAGDSRQAIQETDKFQTTGGNKQALTQLNDLKARVAQLKAEIGGATGEYAKLKALMDTGQLGEDLKNADSPLRKQILGQAQLIDQLTKSKEATTSYKNSLEELKEKYASINGEMQNSGKEFEKTQQALTSGKIAGLSKGQQTELLKWAKMIDEITPKLKEFRKEQSQSATAQQLLESTTEAMAEKSAIVNARLMDPTLLKKSSEYVALLVKQKLAIEAISKTGDATAVGDAKRQAADNLQSMLNNESVEEIQKLREKSMFLKQTILTDRQVKQQEFDYEVGQNQQLLDQFQGTLEQKKALQTQFDDWFKARQEKLARDTETPLQKMLREWKDTTQQMGEFWKDVMSEAADKLTEFVTTGKLDFQGFLTDILNMIVKMQIQQALAALFGAGPGGQSIFGQLFASLGRGIGGAFGGGGGGNEAAINQSGDIMAAYSHSGGMGSEARYARLLPADMFAFAERFHSGRKPHINDDEIAAVLRKDEYVFTPQQLKGLGKNMSQPNVTLNVMNQTGVNADVEQKGARFDGEQMILDVVMKHATRPGAFRDNLRNVTS